MLSVVVVPLSKGGEEGKEGKSILNWNMHDRDNNSNEVIASDLYYL